MAGWHPAVLCCDVLCCDVVRCCAVPCVDGLCCAVLLQGLEGLLRQLGVPLIVLPACEDAQPLWQDKFSFAEFRCTVQADLERTHCWPLLMRV